MLLSLCFTRLLQAGDLGEQASAALAPLLLQPCSAVQVMVLDQLSC